MNERISSRAERLLQSLQNGLQRVREWGPAQFLLRHPLTVSLCLLGFVFALGLVFAPKAVHGDAPTTAFKNVEIPPTATPSTHTSYPPSHPPSHAPSNVPSTVPTMAPTTANNPSFSNKVSSGSNSNMPSSKVTGFVQGHEGEVAAGFASVLFFGAFIAVAHLTSGYMCRSGYEEEEPQHSPKSIQDLESGGSGNDDINSRPFRWLNNNEELKSGYGEEEPQHSPKGSQDSDGSGNCGNDDINGPLLCGLNSDELKQSFSGRAESNISQFCDGRKMRVSSLSSTSLRSMSEPLTTGGRRSLRMKTCRSRDQRPVSNTLGFGFDTMPV